MNIGALIVTYKLQPLDTLAVVRRLSGAVSRVCIVDNSETDSSAAFAAETATDYLPLCRNTGIAYAQNVGLHRLMEAGCEAIFFADQDSEVDAALVSGLAASLADLQKREGGCAGVAPLPYNKADGQPYPYQGNEMPGAVEADGGRIVPVSYLMNSGALIPVAMFEVAGLMDETLFIDGVDSEWCWRAAAKCGARFYVDERLRLGHMLGLGSALVAGRRISLTPPYRLYYQIRNYMALSRRDYVPRWWTALNGPKYLQKAVYYPLCRRPRLAYAKYIIMGFVAGLARLRPTQPQWH